MIVSDVSYGTVSSPVDRGDHGTAAGGEHEAVRRDGLLRTTVAGLEQQLVVADEVRLLLEQGDVLPGGAPVPARLGDVVDPPEDPVADVGPAHVDEVEVDPEGLGLLRARTARSAG